VRLRRFRALAVIWMALGHGAMAAERAEDVSVAVDGGTLHGTLIVPDVSGPVPVALILPGSGPTDRDGNQAGLRNDVYKLLAEGLSAAGIASLRIDKRGIGESAAAMVAERDLTVGTYVGDIIAWSDLLRDDDRFASLSLVGHSEGALYAILAAEDTQAASIVLVSGTGRRAADTIRSQLEQAGLPGDLRQSADTILSDLETGRPVPDPPGQLHALFRPSVQPYLMSWFAIDPAERLAATGFPVLILQGTTDIQVSVEDAERLAAAREDSDLVVLDGVNHILREAPADRDANIATYTRPDLPLADDVVPAISRFIRQHSR